MRAEADLSLCGQVRLLAAFRERLELEEVTLVFNDWCGAQLLIAEGWDGPGGWSWPPVRPTTTIRPACPAASPPLPPACPVGWPPSCSPCASRPWVGCR
jgi:hypothetical protein